MEKLTYQYRYWPGYESVTSASWSEPLNSMWGSVYGPLEGEDMLYLVSAVETQVDEETGKVITDTLGPDLVLASGDNDAKIKALMRWGVPEESLDKVQVYILSFRPV